MPLLHDAEGEAVYLGGYTGVVLDNADPRKLGRAKITVPGLVEPPGVWAFPIGGAHSSGAKSVGAYDVPPKGATVKVSFSGGNIDHPEYAGGWHGNGEQLSVGPTDPKDAHKIKVFESDRFLIVLNGIGGAEELLIRDKVSGDQISMTPARTQVKSSAKVQVIAPEVDLGGSATKGVAREGDSTRLTFSTADLGVLAAALITTAGFTSPGPPGPGTEPAVFTGGEITSASGVVKAVD